MEFEAIAGMLFTLVLFAMIGGFFLVLPIARRLGLIMEQRLNDRTRGELPPEQIRQLQTAIEALRADLDQLAERQQFTEALVAGQPANRLARAGTPKANGIAAEEDI